MKTAQLIRNKASKKRTENFEKIDFIQAPNDVNNACALVGSILYERYVGINIHAVAIVQKMGVMKSSMELGRGAMVVCTWYYTRNVVACRRPGFFA